MSRTDDIINVAGHRLSTGAIEEVLSEHQSVAECAVIGIADKLKGQLPIGLIALKAGVQKDNETISKECIQMVRDKVGPVAAFKTAIVVIEQNISFISKLHCDCFVIDKGVISSKIS